MNAYAGVFIVASLVIAVIFFSFTLLGWCSLRSIRIIQSLPPTRTQTQTHDKFSSCMTSLESHSITFLYKAAETVQGTSQTECVICLTPFEEEDSVRKLHSCKHIFHTHCIDTWLGSHTGCPLCRTQIGQAPSPKETFPSGSMASEENGQNQMILVTVSS